jgi:hypothetical protein
MAYRQRRSDLAPFVVAAWEQQSPDMGEAEGIQALSASVTLASGMQRINQQWQGSILLGANGKTPKRKFVAS